MSRAVQLVLLSAVILTCLQTGAGQHVDAASLSAAVREILLPIMKEIKNDLNSVKDDLNSVKNDLSSLNKSLNASLNRISDNVEAHDNHVTTELMELDQNLQQNFTLLLENSFGYNYLCGGTGGWRRVVYLNFTDPNTPCPSSWKLTSLSKRSCGRVDTNASPTCDSVIFPVSGGDYTIVCGRIRAYQHENPGAFEAYDDGVATTIDSSYVAGISLTYGSPRQHIWTFVAGYSETIWLDGNWVCPCDTTFDITIPPFVGEDYFCESGYNSGPQTTFFPDDPLWDGDGCTANSTCCSFNNPPYFTKQLPSPTTDDIEARLCQYFGGGRDTPIEFIELYVK